MQIRKFALATALVAFAIGTSSCGSDSTSPSQTVFGTYSLVSVNGQALPVTLSNTSFGTVVIQSATVDLISQSGSSAYSATVTGTENGGASTNIITDAGTFTSSGSTLTFSSSLAPPLTYQGTLNGNALTVTIPAAAIGGTGTLVLGLQR